MTISLSFTENEAMLITKYAELNELSVAELLRQSVMERIQDEYDLQTFEQALQEFKANPITYTLTDIKNELGLQ